MAIAGTLLPRTGLARGLLLSGGRAGLLRGLRGARPDLVASSLARERRGLLFKLWGDRGASRSSKRWVRASFCCMAMRSKEFSVFFSSSAAASCLCISSNWVTYWSHLRDADEKMQHAQAGKNKIKAQSQRHTTHTNFQHQL